MLLCSGPLCPAHTTVHHTTNNIAAIILCLNLPILLFETAPVYLLSLLLSLPSFIMGKYTLNISCKTLISFLRSSFSMHLSRYRSPHFTLFSTPYYLFLLGNPLSCQIPPAHLAGMDPPQAISTRHHWERLLPLCLLYLPQIQ